MADDLEIIRLRDRLDALERILEERRTTRDQQQKTALDAMDKRLDAMNEIRAALSDQATRLLPRAEFFAAMEPTTKTVDLVRLEMATLTTTQVANDRNAQNERAVLDKRLESMNEFRSQLKDQAAGFYTRNEHLAFEADIEGRLETWRHTVDAYRTARDQRSEADLAPIRARLENMGRPNWPVIIGMASTLFVLIAGGWSVMGLKIESAIGGLVLSVAQLKASQTIDSQRIGTIEATQNQRGTAIAEIGSLKTNYQLLSDRNATIRADVAKQGAALAEIETQFCAADIIRNLMHAQDMRLVSVLWSKIMPSLRYPTDNAYYPKVCNRESQG